ncbi:MAG: hypothetical protein CMM94_05470 [Rickettsiales bacterium]|nr:hypothetical protein [Rickettsiales bacterium]
MTNVNGTSHVEPLGGNGNEDLNQARQLYAQAAQYLQQNQLQEAANLCQHILQTHESFAPAYYLMAELFMRTQNHEKALKFNDLALKFAPKEFEYLFQRGKVLFVLRRWDDAEEAFLKALKKNPKNVITAMLLGDVYAQQGDYDKASRQFDKALKIKAIPEIFEHKGLCLQQKGDLAEARKCFEKVRSMNPNHGLVYMHLGKVAIQEGNMEEGEELIREAAQRAPQSYEALGLLAGFQFSHGEEEQALATAKRATQTNPYNVHINMMLSRIMTHIGYLQDAETVLRHVLQLDPDNLQAMVSLVYLLNPLGKHDEALELIAKAKEGAPENESLVYLEKAMKGETVDVAPEKYVSQLFDGYAEQFDLHLQEKLGYNTPSVLASRVREALSQAGEERTDLSLLDLGCGTGLGAEALKDATQMRVGVDLSEKMVAKAQAKGVYDEVYVDELVRYMRADERQYDLVICVDTLVYIGKLDELFAEAAQCTVPNGLFSVSVENGDDVDEFVLRASGRYAHNAAYIAKLGEANGFEVIDAHATVLRKEAGKDMMGNIITLRKSA